MKATDIPAGLRQLVTSFMERQDCLMSICFILCSAVPIICSAFFIRCGTPLVICPIYDVISCAFVVICRTFVIICCGFATICGAYVIICSDFSIIPTFCHSISTVLSLYRVVYALYGVQTILPRVHFALFAVLSSLYRAVVMIYPQCKARVSDPSSSQPDAAILVCFRGKVEEVSLLWKPSLSNWGLVPFWKDSAMRKWIHMSYWPCRKVL